MSTSHTDRRQLILSAALACFNERGVAGTAIGEISSRSGASIGSIYHRFGSKEGIATTLLVEGLRSNADQLEERLRGARGARQGVYVIVESLIRWITSHPEWARFIYTLSHGNIPRDRDEQLQAVNDRYQRLIEGYFGPHIEAGSFRRLPRECFASLVLGPVHDYARRWLSGQVTGDIGGYVDVFASAAWNAVSSSDGS